jgi:hypothetical protein
MAKRRGGSRTRARSGRRTSRRSTQTARRKPVWLEIGPVWPQRIPNPWIRVIFVQRTAARTGGKGRVRIGLTPRGGKRGSIVLAYSDTKKKLRGGTKRRGGRR